MSESRVGGNALDQLRILVVDDDDDARDLLSTVLRHRGATIIATASAREAFEALSRDRPDVLVSDIAMPGEDGFSLIARVRALPELDGGATPAIAVTAFASPTDRRRALAAGFDGWLPKPIDHDALVTLIADVCDPRRSREV